MGMIEWRLFFPCYIVLKLFPSKAVSGNWGSTELWGLGFHEKNWKYPKVARHFCWTCNGCRYINFEASLCVQLFMELEITSLAEMFSLVANSTEEVCFSSSHPSCHCFGKFCRQKQKDNNKLSYWKRKKLFHNRSSLLAKTRRLEELRQKLSEHFSSSPTFFFLFKLSWKSYWKISKFERVFLWILARRRRSKKLIN